MPTGKPKPVSGKGTTEYLERVYGLHAQVFEVDVPADSPLVGEILADINNENNISTLNDAAGFGAQSYYTAQCDLGCGST